MKERAGIVHQRAQLKVRIAVWRRRDRSRPGRGFSLRPGRVARALRQDTAGYRADPGWVSKKYEALNDAHKKMIAELVIALLRLEGKR